MKNNLFLFFALIPFIGLAQVPSCCVKPEGMAMLASNEKFIAAHEDPLPFTYKSTKGQMITFPTADGKTGSAFVVSSGMKTSQILFVFHEWWGLNDYIKREAETLQSELGNVVVYAIDLYDGEVAADKDKAAQLAKDLKPERAQAIIQGLLKHVGKSNKIATLGWCMGGGWSLQAAIDAGNQGAACVMYYGFPEKDKDKLKTLKSPVLFIQATQDQFITPALVEQFDADMKSLKKKMTIKPFDADHAFANPSNPKYKKDFAEQAHKLAVNFIRQGY